MPHPCLSRKFLSVELQQPTVLSPLPVWGPLYASDGFLLAAAHPSRRLTERKIFLACVNVHFFNSKSKIERNPSNILGSRY